MSYITSTTSELSNVFDNNQQDNSLEMIYNIPSSFNNINEIRFNSYIISKIYYNKFLVYEDTITDVITDSVFSSGLWENLNLWNNSDLFNN